MSPWTIYWILQLDKISDMLIPIVLLFGALSLLALVVKCMSFDKNMDVPKIAANQVFWVFPTFLMLMALYGFIPTTKTMCAVITIPAVMNNEELTGDAIDVYRLGMEKLKEVLGEEKTLTKDAE